MFLVRKPEDIPASIRLLSPQREERKKDRIDREKVEMCQCDTDTLALGYCMREKSLYRTGYTCAYQMGCMDNGNAVPPGTGCTCICTYRTRCMDKGDAIPPLPPPILKMTLI